MAGKKSKDKGRVAGEKAVVVMAPATPTQTETPVTVPPLQQIQSATVAPRESLAGYNFKRTAYSPFGHYPVSDGLIDYGEGQSTYR